MNKKYVAVAVIVLIVIVGVYAYISANTVATKIQITSNSTLKNGDAITVLLKDDYKHVYPGQPVYVKILDDSGWAVNYNATTDDSGVAHIQIFALDNGNYTVHASFNGTMFLTPCKSVSELEINDGLGG